MEFRVAGHQLLDPLQVVGVDGQLELAGELEGFDVSLELGPAREAVLPRDLELGLGERRRLARLEPVLGLILEVPEVGTLGELARRFLGIAGHGNLLSVSSPDVRTTGRKKVRIAIGRQVGLNPFRGPDAPCTQMGMLSAGGGGRGADVALPSG